jgi:uncharacterized membrane protein YqaE (UPF0057 family)
MIEHDPLHRAGQAELAFRVGFLTALCGVVGVLIGKGQLEVPTIVSSLLCLLIWFLEAVTQ